MGLPPATLVPNGCPEEPRECLPSPPIRGRPFAPGVSNSYGYLHAATVAVICARNRTTSP
jgi:hypothetical protein